MSNFKYRVELIFETDVDPEDIGISTFEVVSQTLHDIWDSSDAKDQSDKIAIKKVEVVE